MEESTVEAVSDVSRLLLPPWPLSLFRDSRSVTLTSLPSPVADPSTQRQAKPWHRVRIITTQHFHFTSLLYIAYTRLQPRLVTSLSLFV